MELSDRVAIVTGSARGIGKAIVERLAEAGAFVVAVDRDSLADTLSVVGETSGRCIGLQIDITDEAALEDAFATLAAEHGGIDILVNNAGIIARGTLESLDHETWRRVMDVNVNGTFNCCRAALPYLSQSRGGRIINIASIAGKMGDITAAPAYGTSKGAIITLTRSLARQLAEKGITVNAIAPHAVESDMSAQWSPEKRAAVIDSIPLKRLAQPDEIADAVLYLASDRASFITGETLNINGGALMD